MQLFDHELAEGPLALIVRHLAKKDRARLALTCRAGRRAALAAPVEKELLISTGGLASFNSWLSRRCSNAFGGQPGAVQDVSLPVDPHGRSVATACHLARCGTESLTLQHPSPGLLETACTISSLTSLSLRDPQCSLNPLGALRQLQSLHVATFQKHAQDTAPPACRLPLPALTKLMLASVGPCTLNLDGCSALREVEVSQAVGLALTASRHLPQLARLKLFFPRDLAVPWQQLPALQELVLLRENDAGLLEGATHLASLRSLHVDCFSDFVLPPGDWLAGVTRLVLEHFSFLMNPEDVDWAACATGVEELVLWLKAYAMEGPPPAEYTVDTLKWVRWAADRPRLRLVELWVGDESELRHNELLRWAARAEGENVEGMLGRFLMAVADALVHPGY